MTPPRKPFQFGLGSLLVLIGGMAAVFCPMLAYRLGPNYIRASNDTWIFMTGIAVVVGLTWLAGRIANRK